LIPNNITLKAIKGESVTLDCSAKGVPSPIIRWMVIDGDATERILEQQGPIIVS
jgi:hypothetical protein